MTVATIGRRRRFHPPPTARLNPSHPLSQGLQLYALSDGISMTDYASRGLLTTKIGSPAYGMTSLGASTVCTAGGWMVQNSAGLVGGAFTISAFGRLDNVTNPTASDKNIIKKDTGAIDYILRSHATLGWLYYTYRSGVLTAVSSMTGFALGEFAITVTDTSGAQALWVNGVRTATASLSGSSFPATDHVSIGDQQATGEGFIGALKLVAFHNRVLSENEIAMFREDPFQMLVW